jgi:hypothetical protein
MATTTTLHGAVKTVGLLYLMDTWQTIRDTSTPHQSVHALFSCPFSTPNCSFGLEGKNTA